MEGDPLSTSQALTAEADEGSPASARERILEAACDLFAAEGLDSVRIARIATAAGISTSLVHYHFETREKLLEEALQYSYDRASETFVADRGEDADDHAAGSAARTLADRIDQCLPWRGVLKRDWLLWNELALQAARKPELEPVAAQLYARHRDFLAEPIAEGVERGEFKPCDPGEVADFAIALIDGHCGRTMQGDTAMPLSRARKLIGESLARELGLPDRRLPYRRAPDKLEDAP